MATDPKHERHAKPFSKLSELAKAVVRSVHRIGPAGPADVSNDIGDSHVHERDSIRRLMPKLVKQGILVGRGSAYQVADGYVVPSDDDT